MALTAEERETTLTISDDAREWLVSSYRRVDITNLKKNPDLVIEEEGMFEGTPFLIGKLPAGGISIRKKSAGTIKRTSTVKRGAPTAAKCLTEKADGTLCQAIASKATGKCHKHG